MAAGYARLMLMLLFAAMAEMMRADGVDAQFEGWDWRYYAEKVRKARSYNFV